MKTILVVDDDEGIVEVVQIVLESEGYAVKTSMNGTIFQYFDYPDSSPDLVLLDVLLSGEDGRVICQRLKSNEKTKHIPIIMLSAHSEVSRLASTTSADDFLEKPFDVDVLIEMVQKYLPTPL